MSVNNALQAALISALRTDEDLIALLPTYATVPAVFYYVPQGFDDSQPYVTIYEISMLPDDTVNTDGFAATVTIHTWVEEETTAQTGAIMQAIYNLLHRNDTLPVTDYTVTGIDCEFQTVLRDPDGKTRHGVQRFNISFELTVDYPSCN
ncbi:putative tail-head connector protein [Pseudoalteromonas phage PHS3]|nr:putative tail-head connector protein [Pseudoalteromonas phage PHS3]